MPPTVLPTLKVSADRIRHANEADEGTASKSSSRPKAQVERQKAKRKEDTDAMESAVDEWFAFTMAKAAELAERFDKKPRYFLDRFFQGGQKLVYKQTVTNAFNAFKSIKAAELRAGVLVHIPLLQRNYTLLLDGEKENVISIQRDFKEEYDALTAEERAEYIVEFDAMKTSSAHVARHTSRGCIQDLANIARNMEVMVRSIQKSQ